MLNLEDPVALTRRLIAYDTSSANEDSCTLPLADALEREGFEVHRIPSAPGRTSFVARWADGGRLVLSGHADTVPFDPGTWSFSPLSGHVADGRIHGRGASDMKSGLAAMAVAARTAAREGAPGFTLAVTIGEETGCAGARDLTAAGLLPASPIVIVGESTDNDLRFGHKGATWWRVTAHGTQAHGSRPDLGENAVTHLAEMVHELGRLDPALPHEHLGAPTLSVGSLHGGTQVNLVPDRAVAEIDLRTVPGGDVSTVRRVIEDRVPRAEIRTMLELAPLWTDPRTPLSRRVADHVTQVTGRESGHAAGVSYFTDAAVLTHDAGAAYIVGPGEPDQPHTVDESCATDRIVEATELYRRLIHDAVDLARVAG